jgi:uracil-DNA glycosylase
MSAAEFVPATRSLKALREAVQECRGCDLYKAATQAVFGEGLKRADVMLIGEVPGDREDREGHPFVGPAGRELDKGLEAAGIDRTEVYITNAVKHFKFQERGKRRIHQKPSRGEIDACLPWLRAELDVIRPRVIVLLGATAGQALLGSRFRLGEARGRPIESDLAPYVTATAHPSSILRQQTDEERWAAREAFVEDLRSVARQLAD